MTTLGRWIDRMFALMFVGIVSVVAGRDVALRWWDRLR